MAFVHGRDHSSGVSMFRWVPTWRSGTGRSMSRWGSADRTPRTFLPSFRKIERPGLAFISRRRRGSARGTVRTSLLLFWGSLLFWKRSARPSCCFGNFSLFQLFWMSGRLRFLQSLPFTGEPSGSCVTLQISLSSPGSNGTGQHLGGGFRPGGRIGRDVSAPPSPTFAPGRLSCLGGHSCRRAFERRRARATSVPKWIWKGRLRKSPLIFFVCPS